MLCFVWGKRLPADTAAFAVPYGDNGTAVSVQRFRDVMKLGVVKKNKDAVYLMLGIENQSELHFAMPVRNMLYDALAYTAQVEETAKKHRTKQKSDKLKADQNFKKTAMRGKVSEMRQVSSAEYLSGFYSDDRLAPVVTLVVYFGADIWDAPKSLHEMLDCKDEEILSFVADYRLNLIAPAQMSEAEIEQFKSSFREVMLFIKYSTDKQKLSELISRDDAFRRVDRKAARVMSSVTGSDLQFAEEEEAVDMCLAIDGMLEDARKEGLSQGLKAGLLQAANETAQRMFQSGKYALEDIAEISGLELSKVQELQQLKESK